MDAFVHQQPRTGDAGLPGGGEDAGDHALHRVVDVGVRKHQLRRLAAEFERQSLEGLRRVARDVTARVLATGEGDLVDAGMRGQCLADIGAEAGDDVDDAGGEAGFLDETREFQRRGRGEFRWLEYHGAARRQRRREFPCRQQQRRIPRRDRRYHADRFVAGVGEHVGLVDRHHRALDLVGEPTEVIEPLRDVTDLPAHLGIELAVVLHLGRGKMIDVTQNQIAELAQKLAALRRMHVRPRAALQRLTRGGDRLIDVALIAFRNPRPRLRQKRIDGLKAFTGFGGLPLAADETLIILDALHASHDGFLPARLS